MDMKKEIMVCVDKKLDNLAHRVILCYRHTQNLLNTYIILMPLKFFNITNSLVFPDHL